MIYDAVIVGSGPVGSLLAHLYARQNLNVLLIEKNPCKTAAREQKPDFVDTINQRNYCPAESGRAGGNGWLWGGKCYLFDSPTLSSWGFDPESVRSSEQSLKKLFSVTLTEELNQDSDVLAKSFRLKNKNPFDFLNIAESTKVDQLYESTIARVEVQDALVHADVVSGESTTKICTKKIVFCCGALGNAFNLLNLFQTSNLKFSDHPHFKLNRQIFQIADDKDIFGRSYITNTAIERAIYMENSETKLCGQIDYKSGFSDVFKKMYLQTRYEILRKLLLKLESISRFFIYRLHKISSDLFEWEFWSSQNAGSSSNSIYLSKKTYKNNLRKISISWDVNTTEEIRTLFQDHGTTIPFKKVDESLKKSRAGLHPSAHLPYVLGEKLNGDFELTGHKGVYFISSGSFPDGHVFNPTWTVMVLAQLWFNRVAQ